VDNLNKYNLKDDQIEGISEAILAGEKIQAIKLFREATGLGLKEAKDEIEELIAVLAKEHPEILRNQSQPHTLCAVLASVAVAVILFVIFLLT